MIEKKITLAEVALFIFFIALVLITGAILTTGQGGCIHPTIRTPTPLPTATQTPTPVPTVQPTATPTPVETYLTIQGDRFAVNGTPTFLAGVSYYGALAGGCSIEEIREDIDYFIASGLTWARIWVGWNHTTQGGSIWWQGQPIPAKAEKLHQILNYANRHGFVLDLTGTYCPIGYPGATCDTEPWNTEVQVRDFWVYMATEFKQYRNWYADIANEHDVMRAFIPEDVRMVRDAIKAIDPDRLVTCSGNQAGDFQAEGIDFFSPHLGRGFEAWRRTCPFLERTLPVLNGHGINLQEPFRNGYFSDNYLAADFCKDVSEAIRCGAMAWCFHTAAGFDMTNARFRDRLDSEERAFLGMVVSCK
jgi:hypothetical protein